MKKTILIMDQDYQFLSLYKHVLTQERFFILKCRNLESVNGFIDSIRVDVIICDADKPQGCGIELLRRLEKINSKIPVIIVSGAFYPADKIISEQAYAFLPKIQILDTLPKLIAEDSLIWKQSNTIKTT